jgi:hypothetical protein
MTAMTDHSAQILQAHIMALLTNAFAWNRAPSGEVMILNEPVQQALAQVVAGFAAQQMNPEEAIYAFAARCLPLLNRPGVVPGAELSVRPELKDAIARALRKPPG